MTSTQLFADIGIITRWLDESNKKTDPDVEDVMRILKISEELGEVTQAYIGMTGQNPRKGYTHTIADVEAELADVVVTALCAIQRFTQSAHLTEEIVLGKIDSIIKRAELSHAGILR
ncbi:MAG TPA: MazG-like family protein [Puia sp.]|nr:MazG-like family protein [Puia sp.]